MKPLLSLVMMVKDEAKSIRGVLESAKPFVDCFTVIDTGSSDGTPEIAKEVLAGVPGRVLHESFLGYAATRNRVLELDKENDAVFSLMLSGDEFLHDGDRLREYLETQRVGKVHCYFVKLALDDGLSYQARILRTGSRWKYDDFDCGVDEVPVHPDGLKARVLGCTGGYIEHVVSDPIARMNNIWEKHIPLLRAALDRNPQNARALELLVQKITAFLPHAEDEAELQSFVTECCDLYRRRFELPFAHQELKFVMMMNFIDTARLDRKGLFTVEELFGMADVLCKENPERPEPYCLRALIASTNPKALTRDVYLLALEAAKKAEEIRLLGGLRNSSPLDMACEWKAHRLAAIAAANLGKASGDLTVARDHIAAGLAVGGPFSLFKGILDDGRIEAKVLLA